MDTHENESTTCSIKESDEGIARIWDVRLPSGGGVQVTLTPRRATFFMGCAREMPPHLAWRSADAIAAQDAKAFARALMSASDAAEALPRVTVEK